MKKFFSIILLTTLLAGCLTNMPSDKYPANTTDVCEDKYKKMRYEFASSTNYNAYSIQIIEKVLIDEGMEAWNTGDVVTTVIKFQEAIDICPISIETHRRLADTFEIIIEDSDEEDVKNNFRILEKKHRKIADGLVASILKSGTGKSPETAYKVISISEEYMALLYLELSATEQSLIEENGRFYDLITAKDLNGKTHEIYFDITLFHSI
jgi:uncharacterized phage-associated protein